MYCRILAIALLACSPAAFAAEQGIRFNRDVRPILAENCFACHGPDGNKRKAKLRLDTREGLFDSTPKRDAIVVPGQLDKSELWSRISTTNLDDRMPPVDSQKELKPAQILVLKRWIVEGAPWQGHWSFVKPERPPVPAKFKTSPSRFPVRNPIDAFVLAKLESMGLKPNGQADSRTLARRLSLDLTGLPPQPEEVHSFVADKSKDACTKLVRRLLASPHYGEHRARYWLDAARYADTHGLHFDNYREMWPYRDWVIKAFNQNMPFDRFTIWQIAGDLLTDEEVDALIATGFHRCNVTTNEGGTIDDENLANYANDRVTTTSWVWLGLTMNCAACHDHKFDPITTKDFYSMAAFFRNTTQAAKDGNSKDSTPSLLIPQTTADAARWKALPAEMGVAQAKLDERRQSAKTDFKGWIATATPDEFARQVPANKLIVHVPLNEGLSNVVSAFVTQGAAIESARPAETAPLISIKNKPVESVKSVVSGFEPQRFRIHASGDLDWKEGGKFGLAPKLTKDANFDLGDLADFERTNQFSYGCWVRISSPGSFGTLIARLDQDSAFRGWDLAQVDKKFAVHIVSKWPDDAIKVITKEDVLKPGEWQHVFATYDGSGKGKGVKLFVDGVAVSLRVEKDELKSSIRSAVPLRLGQRSKSQALDGGRLQDVRIYDRQLSAAEVTALVRVAPLSHVLSLPAEQRTKEQSAALFEQWLGTRDSVFMERAKQLAAFNSEREAIKARNPVTHIQQEKKDSAPMAYVLFRGQYDQPRDKVGAETPAVLPSMPTNAPRNRLSLAQWLVSRDNPLTARVTVNRIWQEFFGMGLVKTAEDFGVTGESPSHPELLDWLAVEFQESGWDIKHMVELIVTSSTYQQSAEVTPAKLEKDPQNRFFSRGPRFRMDAEMVRDYALAASGLLVEKIGGAPVKPYQPDGVWEVVGMPESNTRKYKRDNGESLYRRSIYTFWKRGAPPPEMDIFNAPSREVCTVRRERTNTPLQALATLNDPQCVEAARHLAQLALQRGRGRNDDALDFMAERLLARSLSGKERSILNESTKQMLAYYEQHPDAAQQLIEIGESKPDAAFPAPRLAAMTMVANELMNLDEVLNK